MGQKVNSNGLRYGIYKEWQSRWISNDNKKTAQWLVQDDKIRTYFMNKWKLALVSSVQIERSNNDVHLFVNTSQPGLFSEQDTIKKIQLDLNKMCGRQYKFNIIIVPIVNTYVHARIVAREIADAIERRVSFRTAQKQAIKKVMKAKALGVKTKVSGRLGGVEMAREEGYSEGVIPLSSLRADIDYALEEAHTTYGLIGVKVWINRGEIFSKGEVSKVINTAPTVSMMPILTAPKLKGSKKEETPAANASSSPEKQQPNPVQPEPSNEPVSSNPDSEVNKE